MSTPFPTLPIGINSRLTVTTGRAVDHADDGTAHGRDMFSNTQYTWALQFPNLDATQRSTLWTFYNTNKAAADITLVVPGDSYTYTLMFTDKGVGELLLPWGKWDMTAELTGTRA